MQRKKFGFVSARRGHMARRPGAFGGAGSAYDASSYLEESNDAQIGALSGKVTQLKELSIAIGSHVKEDNRLLGDLDNNFDTAGGMLGGTMKRLGALTTSKDSRHMLYLGLFVFVVFLLVWKLAR